MSQSAVSANQRHALLTRRADIRRERLLHVVDALNRRRHHAEALERKVKRVALSALTVLSVSAVIIGVALAAFALRKLGTRAYRRLT
jgi:hypothetical protein